MPSTFGGSPPTQPRGERYPIYGDRVIASRLWGAAGYKPHAGQASVHSSRTRNRVVSGGRREGKSEVGAWELFVESILTKGYIRQLEEFRRRREFWIVGPEYSDSEKEFRKLYDALKANGAPMDKPGTYYNAHAGDMQLSMYGGRFLCIGKSAKYPDQLVGEGVSGAVMAEAAKLKLSTWYKYVRPTLADFSGWSIHSSTPEGRNWFYDLWREGQDPSNQEWESWRLPSWLNPYVYPRVKGRDLVLRPGQATSTKSLWSGKNIHNPTERDIATLRAALEEGEFNWNALVERLGINPEIASMVRDLPEAEFNQEIGADFSAFVGRVFADFDEELHVGDFHLDYSRPCYAAVDYGYTNPFVWLLVQIDHWGDIYVLDELYETGLTTDDAIAVIQERSLAPRNLSAFYADPADPNDTLTISRKLRVDGIGGGATGGPINDRLRLIRNYLKMKNEHLPWGDPERKPRLMIDRRCKATISDFNLYKYPGNGSENPEKKNDHAPEALGRFFMGHFGPVERDTGRTRVRRARQKRR